MNNQITIEQLQESIQEYQEAVDAADSFTDTNEYEDYLTERQKHLGLCRYMRDKDIPHGFVNNYTALSGFIYSVTYPEKMTIKQMKFCIEIRLTTLKWELGLRLAEEQSNQSQP